MDSALKAEIDGNFDFFQRSLKGFLVSELDRYLLIRHQAPIAFFDEPEAADRHGRAKFADGLYSIQRVTAEPADLGLFSDAAH